MALNPGDIAFVEYNSDDPDRFAFVALVDIAPGEVIAFTDNGWLASGGFRATEGVFAWTSPAEGVTAGSVVTVVGGVPSVGAISASGSLLFSTSGDQLLAWQGDAASPTFLAALQNDGAGFQADATSSNTSALPTGLTLGLNALALDEIDNARYAGPLSGDRATLQAALFDKANWVGSDADALSFEGTFEIAAPTFAIGQSFELEATGAQYVDTGDAASDHDLVNNPGQAPVDSTAASAGTLGFDARYVNTRGDVGLTDGDFVGVTGFTGDVGAFTDGSLGYQLQDPDGLMIVEFDDVDLSAVGAATVSLDWFLVETGWETDDLVRIYVDTVTGGASARSFLLDSSGADIDGLGIEGAWRTASVRLSAEVDSARLVVELDSNSATEALYIDDILFAEAAPTALSLAALDAAKDEGDAGATAFTFTVTRSGDLSGATSVDWTVSGGDADAADFGGALPSGTISFDPDETEKTITVAVSGDTAAEAVESFTVTLSNPTGGASVTTAEATGTIGNDDGVPITVVSTIQGPGFASPLVGQTVTIEAVVVADFQGAGGLRGFYVQEEDADADADPLTSEGLFVFDGSSPAVDVQVGDRVRVTAVVAEFDGLTELTDVMNVEVLASDVTLPTAATLNLPYGDVAELEAVEGMRVTIPDTLYVTEYFNYDRFGEVRLSAADAETDAPGTDGRLDQYTQFNDPDPEGYADYQEAIAKRQIVLDDGSGAQNPDVLPFARDGQPLSQENILRGGDTVSGLTGVLDYRFDEYRIQTSEGVDFEAVNERPAAPEEVGGSLTVASFNVLNFFTTLDDGSETALGETLPEDFVEPRGADTQEELDRQLSKLVTSLGTIEADVFGLIEIENEFADTQGDGEFAVDTLVKALNAATGLNYAFVYPGADFAGGDAIANAIIYNADTVRIAPGTSAAILDDSDLAELGLDFGNPVFNGEGTSRAVVAATFEEIATGAEFTTAVSHFKSKGSLSPFGDNADQGDGAGNNNEARLQAAIALDAWLASDPTGSQDPDKLIIGDLNAYAREDPITYLEAQGYADLIEEYVGAGAYSYVFDGQLGTLDYALASQALLPQVTGATEWHINVDEPDAFDYDTTFKPDPVDALFDGSIPFRASDHDPVIVGLDLVPELNPVAQAPGDKRVAGTEAADLIDLVGGRGVMVMGLEGRDVFDFTELVEDGRRDVVFIDDFEAGEAVLGFTAEDVTLARTTGPALQLRIDDDGDILTFRGITELSEIRFDDAPFA